MGECVGPGGKEARVVVDVGAELGEGDGHELDIKGSLEAGAWFGLGLKAEEALVGVGMFDTGTGDQPLDLVEVGEGSDAGEELDEAVATSLRGKAEAAGLDEGCAGEGLEGGMLAVGAVDGAFQPAAGGDYDTGADGGLGLAVDGLQHAEVVRGGIELVGKFLGRCGFD